MYTKETGRARLLQIKPYLNLSAICREVNINKVTLCMFMKGQEFDYQLSVDKLNYILEFIDNL